jgi:GT2 family glycosyltransferase
MSAGARRLCAVVVLYREQPAESLTIRTLAHAIRQQAELAAKIFICIYDNSPHPALLPRDLFACEWVAFQPHRNNGLAKAYNAALDMARQSEMTWLLLLDSDTEITAEFLKTCLEGVMETESDRNIAALVPHIVEGSMVHSPRLASAWQRRAVDCSISGVLPGELIAMNSGSVVRVQAMLEIGGFNTDFWLDYLDYWVFRSLQKKGFQVFVLPATLKHSLSFADAANRMPEARYRNMLAAEHYFNVAFGSRWERIRLKFVLMKRMIIFGVRDRNLKFTRITLHELFRLDSTAKPPRSTNVPRLTDKPSH